MSRAYLHVTGSLSRCCNNNTDLPNCHTSLKCVLPTLCFVIRKQPWYLPVKLLTSHFVFSTRPWHKIKDDRFLLLSHNSNMSRPSFWASFLEENRTPIGYWKYCSELSSTRISNTIKDFKQTSQNVKDACHMNLLHSYTSYYYTKFYLLTIFSCHLLVRLLLPPRLFTYNFSRI